MPDHAGTTRPTAAASRRRPASGTRLRRLPELELTRTQDDRQLYALDGVGTLRLWGRFARHGTAEAGGRRWDIGPRPGPLPGLLADGTPRGTFRRDLHGGALSWDGRDYALRRLGLVRLRTRYALCAGGSELLRLEYTTWSRRPIAVVAGDPDTLEAGLVLFAVFAARKLGSDRRLAGNVADIFAGGQT